MTYEGAIGIDLGTTYSCVGVWKKGRVEIIANSEGNRITPSYVAFTDTERLIGDAAKNQVAMNAVNTVFDAKRLIGRKFSDSVVQSDMKHWPFKVIPKDDDKPVIQVQFHGETKIFDPEQISAMVLVKMKETAEAFLGQKVNKAVVTVPAYFNDSQRQATKDAGTIAGLEVLRIINEPTAAAIAYGLDNVEDSKERNVLIFDFGGGTFDVTLLTMNGSDIEVKATNGDTHFGGGDIDNLLVAHFIDEFKRKYNGKDPSNDKRALRHLHAGCERAKRMLSSASQATVKIDDFFDNIDFQATISRARFEELCDDLFGRTLEPVERVLEDAEMDKDSVHDVVLVGGSTRIPKVRELLSAFFGGKELKQTINPDEAVACGAAVLGFKLTGGESKRTYGLQLRDVTPHTLGIETVGGAMEALIKRNTVIPTRKSQIFSTNKDNQQGINISVFEGGSTITKDCHLLGTFYLSGITPAPCGVPEIEVTFEIEVDGILTVTAKENGTGKRNQIVITNDKGRLNTEEIEQMISEASRYEEQDKQHRARIDAMNSLEKYTISIRNILRDRNIAKRLENHTKRLISEATCECLKWLDNNPEANKEEYERRYKELNKQYESAITESNQRRDEAKKELERTICSYGSIKNDSMLNNKLYGDAKNEINEALLDTMGWVHNNPEASKEEYEHRNKELKKLCDSAKNESNRRRIEAKKELERTICSNRSNNDDSMLIENLDMDAKNKINEALLDTLGWVPKNPEASKEEYEHRNKELKKLCDSAKNESNGRRIEAKKELERTICSNRSNNDDSMLTENLDMDAKNEINEALLDTMGWVHNNPEASKEEYEHRNKELKKLCDSAKNESNRRRIEAKKELKQTIFSYRSNKNTLRSTENLDMYSQNIVINALLDKLEWLNNNSGISKEEFEHGNRELKELCDSAKAESNQRRDDAKSELERTVCAYRSDNDDSMLTDSLDIDAQNIINEAINESVEWLHNNQEASKEEYEHRNKELKELYESAQAECKQRRADAKRELERIIFLYSTNENDSMVMKALDLDTINIINEALHESQEWLHRNQEASKEQYDRRNKELKELCESVKAESKQRRDEAKRDLERIIFLYTSNENDLILIVDLDMDSQNVINKAVLDILAWLHRNPEANKEDYEIRSKELKELCESAKNKSNQRRGEAKKELERTICSYRSDGHNSMLTHHLDIDAQNIINEAINESQEWLDNNQEANKEEYEHRSKELNELCESAKNKSNQRRGEAKKELERTICSYRSDGHNSMLTHHLDIDAQNIINEAINESQEWLDNNQEANKEEYEHRNKELNELCESAKNKSNQRRIEAKKELERTICSYRSNTDDSMLTENFDMFAKNKINEALLDILEWVHNNPEGSEEEYERRNKELKKLCESAKAESSKRRAEAKNELELTLRSNRSNTDDSLFTKNVDMDSQKIIDEGTSECQEWLNNNQEASKEEYERRNKELKELCKSAKIECNQRLDEAKKELEETLFSCRSDLNDAVLTDNLDIDSQNVINKAVLDILAWLHRNPEANKEDYEIRNKKLKELCDRAKIESHQRRIEAKRELEQTICSYKSNENDLIVTENLDMVAKEKINEAASKCQEWFNNNQEANKEEFERHNIELKELCESARAESNQRRVEGKRELKQTVFLYRNSDNDLVWIRDFDKEAKNKINVALLDILEWVHNNPEGSEEEYERRNKELKALCESARAESSKRRAEAKNELELTLRSNRSNTDDSLFTKNVDMDSQKIIDEGTSECQEWLNNNQEASKEEYERRNKELKALCESARAESSKGQIEANKELERTISSYRSNNSGDSMLSDNLDSFAKNKINEALLDNLAWLHNNPEGSKEEYERRNKELKELCEGIKAEINW